MTPLPLQQGPGAAGATTGAEKAATGAAATPGVGQQGAGAGQQAAVGAEQQVGRNAVVPRQPVSPTRATSPKPAIHILVFMMVSSTLMRAFCTALPAVAPKGLETFTRRKILRTDGLLTKRTTLLILLLKSRKGMAV